MNKTQYDSKCCKYITAYILYVLPYLIIQKKRARENGSMLIDDEYVKEKVKKKKKRSDFSD